MAAVGIIYAFGEGWIPLVCGVPVAGPVAILAAVTVAGVGAYAFHRRNDDEKQENDEQKGGGNNNGKKPEPPRVPTPTTHPDLFRKDTYSKKPIFVNKKNGKIFQKDLLHKDHYEVSTIWNAACVPKHVISMED